MATWHPPIPAGKLYSEDAIKLGSALAMLVWCYDGVQRGGTLEVSIEKAAQELHTPYRTVKEWWRLLRQGPFFSKQVDRGKRGWIVTMADEWLDWHVMGNNYPAVQGQNSALENDDERDTIGQGPVKARSKPGIGQNSALENPAYKVDQHDHEIREGVAKKSRKIPPPAQASLDFLHEGVVIYKRVARTKFVQPVSATLIAETITDYAYWEKIVSGWILAGFNPNNIKGMTDWYLKPGTMEARQNGNGRHPPEPARPVMPPADKPTISPDAYSPEETARKAREYMDARKAGKR